MNDNPKKWKLAGFKLEFKELIQPREYNFTTDKIICTINKKDLKKIESACLFSCLLFMV